jgi:hypothetical protein
MRRTRIHKAKASAIFVGPIIVDPAYRRIGAGYQHRLRHCHEYTNDPDTHRTSGGKCAARQETRTRPRKIVPPTAKTMTLNQSKIPRPPKSELAKTFVHV